MKDGQSAASLFRRVQIDQHVWLILITLLAFALRVYRLDVQAIWWDESLSVYRATRDLGAVLSNVILIQNLVTIDTLPQLYFIFLNLLVRAFGITEFALRYFSVMANIVTIPLIYALAHRWFGRNVALVAALLAALSPFYVWFSQEARPYTLVLFFSTLAVYALTRALGIGRRQTRTNADKTSIRVYPRSSTSKICFAVYILSAAAAVYTHYYAIFLLPFHAILITLFVWQSPRRRALILLPAIPFMLTLFLIPQILASMAGNVGLGPTFVPLQTILLDLLNSFSVGVTVNLSVVWWIDAAMLLLFFIGVVSANSKFTRNVQNSLFGIWDLRFGILAYVLIPVLVVFVASVIRPLYQNSRYLIALSPAFYIGVAAGIVTLAQHRILRPLAVIGVSVFLFGAMQSLNNLYFDPHFGKDDHRGWATSLRDRMRPGDFLILDSPHTEELYHYYAGDVVPMTTLPILRADKTDSPAADLAAVRDALTKHARVWFLAMHVPFDDPQNRIEKILNAQGVLIDEAKFAGTSTEISLSLFERALPIVNPNEIGHPLDIAFNGHLHLRGFDTPPSIQSGQRVLVKLYWQIDEPVGEDYAVSLRLIDPAESLVEQWDAIPVGNRAGTSTWSPHQIVVDERLLNIPSTVPTGVYRLVVVPYHAATGNALGDVVILSEIGIKP
ncbi:MAG: glycosyltransferase family 39 protein [Chloroflexi bacterium]|nr:glycosyltransferase family 39 protein [Chloroflexota bacterium]